MYPIKDKDSFLLAILSINNCKSQSYTEDMI